MTNLISRTDAIRWVKTECNPYGKPTLDYDSGLKVIEHLKQMPSDEAKTKCIAQIKIDRDDLEDLVNEAVDKMLEQKTGEWIAENGDAMCSNCGRMFKGSKYDRMYDENFCPNCGARMLREDGEAE